jgi:dihydroorotate dehydrogenase
MYSLLRSLLFTLPTETSHAVSLGSLDTLERLGLIGLISHDIPDDPRYVMGLTFPNPVGLAAGLDKNGDHIDAMAALGFGFIEIGTVTPRPQPGNPQPRLFRLPKANAIINRMGFNNKGIDYLIERVKAANYRGILGINIGKNFDTPVERAVDDYLICMRKAYPHASYIAVNLSSPNTPGLRDLQFGEPLNNLLSALKAEQQVLADLHSVYVPLVVKIAPDMIDEDVDTVAKALLDNGIDGVIATNTTIDKRAVAGLAHGDEAGGLSGAPVRDKATKVIARLAQALEGRMPIIGVGGIDSGEAALEKQQAGADLVQIYTGFIYKGPALVAQCAKALRN